MLRGCRQRGIRTKLFVGGRGGVTGPHEGVMVDAKSGGRV